MTNDPIERAAMALLAAQTAVLWTELSDDGRSLTLAHARAAILAFLDGQEDGVAEAIQDAADIDANSMTYARSVLRALRKAAVGEG